MKRAARRFVTPIILWLCTCCMPILSLLPPVSAADGPLVIVRINGTINPGTADQLLGALAAGEARGARAVIVELDTPGGLLPSMQSMVEAMLAARVPTVVYVSPQGGSAMSAGMFVTIAAHLAAMAPGTTIGAAHPVSFTGQDAQGHAAEKLENFAVSLARAIAEQRGRNALWAEQAVRESVAITDREAVAERVVDLSAADLDSLLAQLEGRTVTVGGSPVTLSGLASAPREVYLMSLRQQVVNLLSDPNIAILLGLGAMLGLGVELMHPGAILPGIVGAICLVLALVAGQIVPIHLGGVALMLLGAVFIGVELYVPSLGVFGVAGIVSLVIGALYAVDDTAIWSADGFTVRRDLLGSVAGVVGLLLFGVVQLAMRALQTRVSTGGEGLVGKPAVVLTDFVSESGEWTGKVRVSGEIWSARLRPNEGVAPGKGERLVVASLPEGLSLLVKRERNL